MGTWKQRVMPYNMNESATRVGMNVCPYRSLLHLVFCIGLFRNLMMVALEKVCRCAEKVEMTVRPVR